jgi:predicted MFS family arabinose efflux permease
LLGAGTFAYFLALGLGIPAYPRYLTGPLHGTPTQVGVAVAMFSVAAIATRPLVAPAARRVAPSTLLALGAGGAGLAIAATIAAKAVVVVVALRAAAGVGDAFVYVLASSAVYALAPAEQHARALSRFSALVSAGILLGPILAESLRGAIGFSGLWLLGGGLCAVACACVWRLPLAREPAAPQRRAVVERAAVLPGVVIAAQTWALAAFTVFVALYASHLGLGSADVPFAVVAAVVLAVRTAGAGIFDRIAPQALATVAMLAATGGLALLALVPAPWALVVASAPVALSQALAFPALMHLAVRRAGDLHRTAAVATFTGFFEAGLATAAVVLGAVLDAFGFTGLYAVAAAVSAAALVPVLAMARERVPAGV